MAIVVVIPNGSEYFYAASGVTIDNVIEWTSDTNNNVTIAYSKDSGGGYTSIATGVTSISGSNTYNWSLDGTEYSDILGSATSDGDMRIKITDETTSDNDESNTDFTMRRVSLMGLKPNGTDNILPINNKNLVNIVWAESYDASISNVKIEYSINGGSSYSVLVASTANTGSYIWNPDQAPTSFTGNNTSLVLRISSADAGHGNNIFEGPSTFSTTDNTDDSTGSTPTSIYGTLKDFPDRFEAHGRVGTEKAQILDEAVVLGQLEAGPNVRLAQRLDDGDHLTYDPKGGSKELKRAFNVIIDTRNNVPRTLRVVADIDSAESDWLGTLGFYGRRYSKRINHNWGLASPYDLQVDLKQVPAGSFPDSSERIAQWEYVDGNNIDIYYIKKNTADAGVPPILAKDEIDITDNDQFQVTLVEIPG